MRLRERRRCPKHDRDGGDDDEDGQEAVDMQGHDHGCVVFEEREREKRRRVICFGFFFFLSRESER